MHRNGPLLCLYQLLRGCAQWELRWDAMRFSGANIRFLNPSSLSIAAPLLSPLCQNVFIYLESIYPSLFQHADRDLCSHKSFQGGRKYIYDFEKELPLKT